MSDRKPIPVYPGTPRPTEQEYLLACEMVIPAYPSGLYSDENRREINRIANDLMMRRTTIQ